VTSLEQALDLLGSYGKLTGTFSDVSQALCVCAAWESGSCHPWGALLWNKKKREGYEVPLPITAQVLRKRAKFLNLHIS